MLGNPFTIASAASLFVPALVAVWKQPFVVSGILMAAAGISTMYHVYDESAFLMQDMIASTGAALLTLMMWLLIASRYRFTSWRVWMPAVTFSAGLVLYFLTGTSTSDTHPNDIKNYELYHTIWHLLGSLAALAVVLTPIDLMRAQQDSLAQIGRDVWNTNFHPERRQPASLTAGAGPLIRAQPFTVK